MATYVVNPNLNGDVGWQSVNKKRGAGAANPRPQTLKGCASLSLARQLRAF